METVKIRFIKKNNILALGAESSGRFCFYEKSRIFISDDFGDLLFDNNFAKYKSAVLNFIKGKKPDIILTDLHPLYWTTTFGKELSRKLKVPHMQIQHHIAHIFSSVGDSMLHTKYDIPDTFYGIAMDGTGYGLDGNIWGGEVFQIKGEKRKTKNKFRNSKPYDSLSPGERVWMREIKRVGSLEEQTMIGGDLAVREPARMIIAILAKLKNKNLKNIKTKDDIYNFVKKYYTRNEFELLYNQFDQNFNCQKTTSTGRILDAVSILLGFAENERKSKHEATNLLEKNSAKPYSLKPKITFSVIASDREERSNPTANAISTGLLRRSDDYIGTPRNDKRWILRTTPLFEYLINNYNKDKRRLAATAQLYIAKGFFEIIKSYIRHPISNIPVIFFAGGMANNKIISEYLEYHNFYASKTMPRGDEGISIGQIIYYLLCIYP